METVLIHPGHQTAQTDPVEPTPSDTSMPRYINDIIVHCTATKAGKELTVADIDRMHKARGWKKIGYHYLILIDGTICRGRAISQPGAHCRGHNAHSVGVAYVGGLDADGQPCDTRTPDQRVALLQLLTKLTKIYHCHVHGHRDYAAKDCPCFDVHNEYDGLYRQVMKI